jgi:hypothetical protein
VAPAQGARGGPPGKNLGWCEAAARWHDAAVSLPPTDSRETSLRLPVPTPERDAPVKLAGRALRSATAWLAVFAVLGTVLVAVVHITDRSEIDQNPGAWLVQSQSFLRGDLVAPLNEDGYLAGTRYQPPLMVVLAGAERLTGGRPLLAWKLIALATFAALLALIAAVGVRIGAGRWAVAAAVGALAAFGPVHQVAVRSGADAMAFAVGLAAIMALAWGPRRRMAALAGVLAGLAILVKLTVVWPLIVGLVWLIRRRASLVAYAASAGLTLLAGVAAFQIASSGRWLENMRVGLGSGGEDGVHGLSSAISRFASAVSGQGALGPVVAVAIGVVGVSALRRRPTLIQLAFVFAVVSAIPLYSDVGVVANHLLDSTVLAVLVILEAFANTSPHAALARVAIPATVLAVCGFQAAMLINPVARAAAILTGSELRPSERLDPFGALIPKGATLLSEDPTFLVIRGERPAIGDPFMARRLFRRHPSWLTKFERRIQAHEFDRVVLFARGTKPPWWYAQVHLGERFVEAVRSSYEPIGVVGEFEVYRPRAIRP